MPTKDYKTPPQDLEAEISVLGSLMIDKNCAVRVADTLTEDDFYHPAHQKIYSVIIELFEKGKPIDLLTISNRLKERKMLKNVGGMDYLTEIVNQVPTSAHAEHYAEIVKEKKVRRDLIRASSLINENATDNDDFDNLLDDVEKQIFAISQKSRTQKFIHIKDELSGAYERLEQLHQGNESGKLRGVPTGFSALDNILSGLQKADFIILGARPSFGKTSLTLDIARNAALKNNKVGIFSLEMSKEQIIDRLIASQSQIPLWRLRTGRIHDEIEFALIQQALNELSKVPLFVEDTASPNILHIRSMARKLQLEHGLDLVVIDYLQLIQPRTASDSTVQQVTEISRGLKSLARELDIPLIAVSQLSRAVDQRETKIPRLSDLRESGCLTGDSLVQLENGNRVSIEKLANRPVQSSLKVVALDDNYKLRPFNMSKAFSSGKKRVFEITTKSGRTIKASANHPFLKLEGWTRLDHLNAGDRIAIPRKIPVKTNHNPLNDKELMLHAHLLGDGCILPKQPYHYTNAYMENIKTVQSAAYELFGIQGKVIPQKNWYHVYLKSPYKLAHNKKHPITEWYEKLGIKRVRSYEKRISPKVFKCSSKKIGLFLKHLWSTDGNLSWKKTKNRKPAGNIYFASSGKKLAKDVQYLLLRVGIQSTISPSKKKGYRLSYHVTVQGAENQLKFLDKIGISDRRKEKIPEIKKILMSTRTNPNNDITPAKVWNLLITPAKNQARMSWREFCKSINTFYCGSTLIKSGVSRNRLSRIATALETYQTAKTKTLNKYETYKSMSNLSDSDVYWDIIKDIKDLGVQEVYDITVEKSHNFIANDIIVHNSLEQDADVVMLLYRKDRGALDIPEEEKNMVELIVAKHRNGPLGTVKLAFDPEKVTFRSVDTRHEENR